MRLPDPIRGRTDLDEWVRQVIRWHFHPRTGSPYWLAKARELGFDPLREVRGFDDLAGFPEVAPEWRSVPARDLVPRGLGIRAAARFGVFETGGTSGSPKRIVDWRDRQDGLRFVHRMLDLHGFPRDDGGDWLYAGPSGPHLVGRNLPTLAGWRGAFCHSIDLDPRWVRRLALAGREDISRLYIDHLADQVMTLAESQPIGVLATTPALLQALTQRSRALLWLRRRVKGVLWFGTHLSAESRRTLRDELLPGVKLVGLYGNTLMGIAPERPRVGGEPDRPVFQPFFPYAVVQVVDPETRQPVPDGQRGRVLVSLLGRELFLPVNLERDEATRMAPQPGFRFDWDGVAEVTPVPEAELGQVVEGVY